MLCSISGNVPEQPVVSAKSGHLFERKLIEKYVRETSKCPITSESLTLDDLLPLKTSKTAKPRTAPATSIPGLLGLFHDEWDALMLETHTLRQSLNTCRQELSHALYQHDAACRVIARLIKERDEARAGLEDARSMMQAEQAAKRAAAADAVMEEAAPGKRPKVMGIPDDVLQELTDVNAQLSKQRKKRVISESLATPDDLSAMSLTSNNPLHKTTQGGITALDTNLEQPSIVATGGVDGTIQVFDVAGVRQLDSLEGHSKRVTGVQFASSTVILSSSTDKTVRIWRQQESGSSFACSAVLKEHQGEVIGVTLHPSRKYFVTGSADATWAFWDLSTASCLRQVADESVKEAYTAIQFHPDGLILGTGTERNAIRIWEVKQQKNVASFVEHTAPVRCLAFSENGYHLASAADDCVKLWDLRKLKVLKTLTPYEEGACSCVAFDHSGQYLAVGGADARVYGAKQDWSVLKSFSDMPKKGVMSLKFGPDAKSLYVGAADHNLRVHHFKPFQQIMFRIDAAELAARLELVQRKTANVSGSASWPAMYRGPVRSPSPTGPYKQTAAGREQAYLSGSSTNLVNELLCLRQASADSSSMSLAIGFKPQAKPLLQRSQHASSATAQQRPPAAGSRSGLQLRGSVCMAAASPQGRQGHATAEVPSKHTHASPDLLQQAEGEGSGAGISSCSSASLLPSSASAGSSRGSSKEGQRQSGSYQRQLLQGLQGHQSQLQQLQGQGLAGSGAIGPPSALTPWLHCMAAGVEQLVSASGVPSPPGPHQRLPGSAPLMHRTASPGHHTRRPPDLLEATQQGRPGQLQQGPDPICSPGRLACTHEGQGEGQGPVQPLRQAGAESSGELGSLLLHQFWGGVPAAVAQEPEGAAQLQRASMLGPGGGQDSSRPTTASSYWSNYDVEEGALDKAVARARSQQQAKPSQASPRSPGGRLRCSGSCEPRPRGAMERSKPSVPGKRPEPFVRRLHPAVVLDLTLMAPTPSPLPTQVPLDEKGRAYPYVLPPAFPGAYPTIAFMGSAQAKQAAGLHPLMVVRMLVKYAGIANSPVKAAFTEAGWRSTKTGPWSVCWGHIFTAEEFANLSEFQRVNHFPGTWELGRKDYLYRNVAALKRVKGDALNIVPRFFILPRDYDEFRADLERNPGRLYIKKPVNSSRGRGVRMLVKPHELERDAKDVLVQHYIAPPYTIKGYKFDLRVYVAATCFDPLRVYVYPQGLARFATERYSQDKSDLKKRCMHLTNYSLNKKSAKYVPAGNAEGEGEAGAGVDGDILSSKLSFRAVAQHLEEDRGAGAWQRVWQQVAASALQMLTEEGGTELVILIFEPGTVTIRTLYARVAGQVHDIVAKAMVAVEPRINTEVKMKVPHRNICFEVWGFDIMLDAELRAWLLEVNTCPALAADSPLDRSVKHTMVADLMHLVGPVPYDPDVYDSVAEARRAQRLTGLASMTAVRTGGTSAGAAPGVPTNTGSIAGAAAGSGCIDGVCDAAPVQQVPRTLKEAEDMDFRGLAPQQLPDIVIESEAEFSRRRAWERVFPCPQDPTRYLDLFVTGRASNLMLCKYYLQQGGGNRLPPRPLSRQAIPSAGSSRPCGPGAQAEWRPGGV
ncbi:hypothetical protein QJQ45_029340 [Haematococcus lacustris]|nr:hypothetical protein QJQ45_029340 [Haematococcus lacustris]